jgi:H+-transporting ATPase
MKAIVSRLQSIEEIAGIDVLCSDKTGTLTLNKLTLGEPRSFADRSDLGPVLAGALASRADDQDPIDQAVVSGLEDRAVLTHYEQVQFVPFDPVRKRTEASVRDEEGQRFRVSKGAPQVIVSLCRLEGETKQAVGRAVDEFAERGYRTLGVACTEDETESWQFLGLLPLYDPPREDSAETIEHARGHGIDVKMVTGDNLAIAKETARQLELPTDIRSAGQMFDDDMDLEHPAPELTSLIEKADGFAEVFPEHKYGIVKALQSRGHLVAMTGDGVNDAPALKQADVGIAVSGATNAAQAAAALVLTGSGLSVIIRAVEEARRIFERMNSYAIYRITETIRIMFFVVLAMIVFNFYPITTVMIILLALLNDLPILTIAYDHTLLSPKPVRWEMRRVLTVATALGLIGVVETFGLLVIAKVFLDLSIAQLQSLVYLKLAVAGHLTLFVARTPNRFLSRPRPAPVLLAAILGTQTLAALIVGFGWIVAPIPWSYVGLVWAYCLVWVFIEDWAKLHVYHHLQLSGKRHLAFVGRVRAGLHNLHSGTA